MKFVSFVLPKETEPNEPEIPYLGVLDGDSIEDFRIEAGDVLFRLLGAGRSDVEGLRWYIKQYATRRKLARVLLRAPMPSPVSIRSFSAFEAHTQALYRYLGRKMPPIWYDVPLFHFANHTTITGPEAVIPYPSQSQALDYGLEVACVIARAGRNIPLDKADDYIMGYVIFNDWTARDLQQSEMTAGFGPAKSKDFANSFGPYLVTPDELEDRRTDRPGIYDLAMVARVNGEECSRGNWKEMQYSFAEMIAYASENVPLQPGDIFASGTVGGGCKLDQTKGNGPWLQTGDMVELEIEKLGVLRNTIGNKA